MLIKLCSALVNANAGGILGWGRNGVAVVGTGGGGRLPYLHYPQLRTLVNLNDINCSWGFYPSSIWSWLMLFDAIVFRAGGRRANSSRISCTSLPRFVCHPASCEITSDSIQGCRRPVGVTVITGGRFGNSGGRLTSRVDVESGTAHGTSYICPSTSTLTFGLCWNNELICCCFLQ